MLRETVKKACVRSQPRIYLGQLRNKAQLVLAVLTSLHEPQSWPPSLCPLNESSNRLAFLVFYVSRSHLFLLPFELIPSIVINRRLGDGEMLLFSI